MMPTVPCATLSSRTLLPSRPMTRPSRTTAPWHRQHFGSTHSLLSMTTVRSRHLSIFQTVKTSHRRRKRLPALRSSPLWSSLRRLLMWCRRHLRSCSSTSRSRSTKVTRNAQSGPDQYSNLKIQNTLEKKFCIGLTGKWTGREWLADGVVRRHTHGRFTEIHEVVFG